MPVVVNERFRISVTYGATISVQSTGTELAPASRSQAFVDIILEKFRGTRELTYGGAIMKHNLQNLICGKSWFLRRKHQFHVKNKRRVKARTRYHADLKHQLCSSKCK